MEKVPARGRYDEPARRERLEWLRDKTGATLEALEETRLIADRLNGNIENAIGAVEVPVGVAGPLLMLGEAARGVVYAPFATTEGALVASASRGATALTRAGGVVTRVLRQRMTRAPVFEFTSESEARAFAEWLPRQIAMLREYCGHVSTHARLRRVDAPVVGRAVHALFVYETGDAAGQNMTTATTWHACHWVLDRIPEHGWVLSRFLIEGNLSSDKKVNLSGDDLARGCAVVAECRLDADTLRDVLKVDAEDLVHAYDTVRAGAARVRMVGCNVNVANTIAAIFTATGQDIACVHESSIGILDVGLTPGLTPATRDGGGVYARLYLPGLVIGTVGGGTHLPAQRALLDMMGCSGEGSVRRLAEIIAGFALALDLSTLSAVATGEFATAHERLGRNRPRNVFREDELTPEFLTPGLRRSLDRPELRVHAVETIDAGDGASILSELTARRLGKRVGLFHKKIKHDAGETDVVVKVKPLDAEVILMMQSMAAACGRAVADAHGRFRSETGFSGCHLRELAVYEQTDPRFVAHVPRVYDIVRDDAREAYVLVLERLTDARLIDSADDPSDWTSGDVEAALRGAGALHAIWMGREAELLRQPWIGIPPTTRRMTAMRPLWDALTEHAAVEFPWLMPDAEIARHRGLIATLPAWWSELESMPRTLVHNDFNPRNIALRDRAGLSTLCAYDWELATIHVPQHDAAELLSFVLRPDADAPEVIHYVELHRRAVAAAGAAVPDARRWRVGFALAARDLLINRFGLYLMGHAFRHWQFMDRSLATLRRLIDLELEKR
jgi:NADP-dependent 3-hydroxy-3-methylglutaryl-CoA reductase